MKRDDKRSNGMAKISFAMEKLGDVLNGKGIAKRCRAMERLSEEM